jgi:parvulin-like peptidyl-prolyl isomerase
LISSSKDSRRPTLRKPTVLFVIALGSVAACGGGESRRSRGANPQAEILATVNGVPITRREEELRAKAGATGGAPNHAASQNVLQTLVREELIFQKSVQLGLDRDEEYRAKVDELEAQLRAFRRQEMAVRFRSYMQGRGAVTDAEARAYFDENAEAIRTRFHVLQILYKGRFAEIASDRQDISGGMKFEEVAARRFPDLQAGGRAPWDLGELRWFQLPPSWRGIVDRMQPGQVSEIIKGENDRHWVVKLVRRTTDPGVTFDSEKARIVEVLRQRKADVLYGSAIAEMTGKALVVYSR